MDKYETGALVGRGSFGSVLLVRRRSDGAQLVMKRLPIQNITPAEMEAYHNEIKLLSELEHPGIVCYMESFVDVANLSLCIVMQYCSGGDLAKFIRVRATAQQALMGPQRNSKAAAAAAQGAATSASASASSSSVGPGGAAGGGRLSERSIKYYFVQMALALHFMHEKNILHRDLKSGNVFLSNERGDFAQLGDFGISKVLAGKEQLANTCIGTPYYMSPELFKNKPYNHKSDVWALGILLYELTELRHAFDASNLSGLATKVIAGIFPPIAACYSGDLRELLRNMLGATPSSRPSVEQILNLPMLHSSIKRYVRAVLAQQQQASAPSIAAIDGSSEGAFRTAHVLNLRHQLDRIGGSLAAIFAEAEASLRGGKTGGKGQGRGTAAATGVGSRSKKASSSAAAATAAPAASFSPDGIDRTLIAAPRSNLDPPPTVRRSRRAPSHGAVCADGSPHSDVPEVERSSSDAVVSPAAPYAPVAGRHGIKSRLAALDREHALRLEELRLEEEARSKLQHEFERLQAVQAQRAQMLDARHSQLPDSSHSPSDAFPHAYNAADARPILAPNASIASTVSNSSTSSSASPGASSNNTNLPIISLSNAGAHSSHSSGPVARSPVAQAHIASSTLPLSLPLPTAAIAASQHHSSRSSSSSSRSSPSLDPARVGRGGARMPHMVLASSPLMGAASSAGMLVPNMSVRVPSPSGAVQHSPQPPSTISPTHAAAAAAASSGASVHPSGTPSPRFLSRRLAAAASAGSAAHAPSSSISPPLESRELPSPRMDGMAGPAGGALLGGGGENGPLKLLKRKAALRASPLVAAAGASAEVGDVSSPVLPHAALPPSPSLGRVPGGNRQRLNAHRVVVPSTGATHHSVAGSPTDALSPGSVMEAQLASERAELARLREERERLEEILTRMDDGLLMQVAPAGSPISGGSTPNDEYGGGVRAQQQPVQRSPPQTAAASNSPSPSPSFSSSTLLPSAFDAPLQYRARGPPVAATAAAAAGVPPVVRSRRHSANSSMLNVPGTAAAATAAAPLVGQPSHSVAPRHRTMISPSAMLPAAFQQGNNAGVSGSSSGGGTRDRILAAKAAQRSEAASAEQARLLAARKEYFQDRVQANQRTKDFYGNAPPIVQSPPLDDGYEAAAAAAASPSVRSSSSSSSRPHAHPPLLVYDDAALALHLNNSLTPQQGEEIHKRAAMQLAQGEQAHVSATGMDVQQFEAQMAHYTRRIESLRSQLTTAALHRPHAGESSDDDGDDAASTDDDADDDAAFDDVDPRTAAERAAADAAALAAAESTLPARRQALAAELQRLLGRDGFKRAYDFLQRAQNDPAYADDARDDRRKISALTRILGADKVKHWRRLDELIFMESA